MKHIAIEGNIGAGKTTLANLLIKELKALPVLEEFEQNPLLPLFYSDRRKHALSLEIAFMAQRFVQWSRLTSQTDLFSDYLVSDYHYEKSRIFASINLEPAERLLFDRLYSSIQKHLSPPDLFIYVHRPLHRLRANIDSRGRAFENQIESSYLEQIDSAYATWLIQAPPKKILRLELDEKKFEDMPDLISGIVDFVHNPHNSFVTLS